VIALFALIQRVTATRIAGYLALGIDNEGGDTGCLRPAFCDLARHGSGTRAFGARVR